MHKPQSIPLKKVFRFVHTAFSLKLAFYLLPFAFCLIYGCSPNPNTQGAGQVYLQGEWQQQPATLQKQLLNYATYHLRFDCDSFYLQINTFSKVNYGADTCMNKGYWTEYTRGTYQQRRDTLYLKGQFCEANFSLKQEGGCFRIGDYEEVFKVTQKTDSLLQFKAFSGVVPIELKLTKKTICHQKPL